LDDKVTDSLDVEFTAMLPNARLVALTPSVGTVAPSCKSSVAELAPDVAVSTTVSAEVTAVAVAVKPALLAPPGS
jgi:hypothetical protein